MGASSAQARDSFDTDLNAALRIASEANSGRYRKEKCAHFGRWIAFCQTVGVPPSLSHTTSTEARLGYLLVFGLRYRRKGATNQPVRADTVDKALLSVAEGITNLGGSDPQKSGPPGQLHPIYSSFVKSLRNDDDPQTRAYPANVTIIRELYNVLDTEDAEFGPLNEHIIDLIIVAFYWLLRPAEYAQSSDPSARTQAFLYRHIHLTIDGRTYHAPTAPLNDANVEQRIECACLEFADQKNAVKGEKVGHRPNNDPLLCPAKALCRIARRLHLRKAPADTPIHRHYNPNPRKRGWYPIPPSYVTNALRHAAKSLESTTGISHTLLSARSLRPGGATALLCANVSADSIQLLGRWKSDAMFRYLRIQAATKQYSQLMLDHGSYTFSPQVHAAGGLPAEAPAPVQALLAHDELYA